MDHIRKLFNRHATNIVITGGKGEIVFLYKLETLINSSEKTAPFLIMATIKK